jgi:hypothetical protein
LTLLISWPLAASLPTPGKVLLIRLIDAASVTKASPEARKKNRFCRLHAAFDLITERSGRFELTDEDGGEKLNRLPCVRVEIRLGYRACVHPTRIANVLKRGAGILRRAGWCNVRWLDALRNPIDMHKESRKPGERFECPAWVAREGGAPLALRVE